MLSFRDRFYTRKVSTAMTSPLAIVALGGGAATGIVAGGFAGPVGAVVGGVLGGIAAWVGRVALAIPKEPKQARIDPFTIAEPWRRLTQDALGARTQFNDAVRRTKPGPIRDRLAGIGHRIDDTIREVWAAARGGHELAGAYSRLDVASTQRELDALLASTSEPNATARATMSSLEAQMATAHRMYEMITATRDQLQLLNARLDESVARSIELSVGTYKPDAFSEVEGAVGSITDELEAIRSALEDTSAAERPGSGPTGTALPQGQ